MNADIREDIKAYLDGELPESRAQEVREAIRANPELASEAKSFEMISASLRAMQRGPMPTGGEVAIARARRRSSSFLRRLGFAAAAASLLLVVVFANRLRPSVAEEAANGRAPVTELYKAPADSAAPAAEGIAGLNKRKRERAYSNQEEPKQGRTADEAQATPAIQTRDVIRTATLTLKVQSAKRAENEVTSLVYSMGGYIGNSESSDPAERNPRVTMIVRVPDKRFDDAMAAFEKLGERVARSISNDDVTAQLVDIEARLKNLRAQEEQYRIILRQARRVGEVIEVQQYISSIRGEIESIDAQRKTLANLVALSTITLTLEQRPSGETSAAAGGWANDAWANAVRALSGVVQALATALIWIFVYSPLWLPIAFFGWVVARKSAR